MIALAVLFSHAYGISARTHDGAHANLSAEVVDGGVLLRWKAPLAGEVTAYRILRRYGSENAELGVLVEDTGSALTRYVDSSARPGTEYVYRVQPIGSDGVEARSNYVRLKTPALAPETSVSAGEPMLDDLPPLLPPADASDLTRGFSLLRGTESTPPNSLGVTPGAFWVGATSHNKIYIFGRSGSTVTYDSSLDITLKDNDSGARGMWSNGVTMWVTDNIDEKLYAYTIATRARDDAKDFTLHSDNDNAQGIWSDSTTMWVVEPSDDKIYAYSFSDQQRDDTKDIELNSDNAEAREMTSDGTTLWVVDSEDETVYAYVLSPQAGETFGDRVTDREPELDSDNDDLGSVAYESGYLYVANRHEDTPYARNRVYAYAVGDARLSDITVDGSSIPAFSAADTGPQHGVAPGTTKVTVAATAVFSGSTVTITSPEDADTVANGHQVNLSAGANAVTIEVTAEGGLATKTYNLGINRGVNSQYGWAAHHDIDTLKLGGNRDPRGIWGNSGNFYIADYQLGKIYAYNLDGARDSTKDFDTFLLSNGIWSDGTTLWVAYSASSNLSAYTLAGGSRDDSADITLGASSRGVWGNSTTIWAVNEETDKLEAYQRSDGTDDDDKDISLDTLNANPAGIWSDDTTMWVADHINDKLYAYALSGGARDTTKDIATSGSGNANPRGLWGNEETLWVTDHDDNKVYSYNLQRPAIPPVAPANLIATGIHSAATLRWDDPGDSTITHYQYRVSNDNGVTWDPGWTTIPNSGARTTYYLVTGLMNETAHTFQVRAVNPVDDGPSSSATTEPGTNITVAVKNLEQEPTSTGIEVGNSSGDNERAQGFVTGSTAYRYVLHSVELDVHAAAAATTTNTVRISTTDSTLQPDSTIATLTGGDVTSTGTTTFLAPDDTLLEPETTYYVVIDATGGDASAAYKLATTGATEEDDTPVTGWSIADASLRKDAIWIAGFGHVLRMSIEIDVVPPPTATITNLRAESGDGEADLTWDPLNDPTVTSIQYRYRETSSSVWAPDWEVMAHSDRSTTDFNLIGLLNGREYTIEVRAANVSVGGAATSVTVAPLGNAVPSRGFSLLRGAETTVPSSMEITTGAFWVGDATDNKIYIFERSGSSVTYNSALDITPHVDNDSIEGMWSNGITMWVTDNTDNKLYAYAIATRTRDDTKDFTLHSDNGSAQGIWSNGTTMWVADNADDKIYAYTFSDQQRDNTKDIDLVGINGSPQNLTSDGVTLWVADYDESKAFESKDPFAYVLTPETGQTFGARVMDMDPDLDNPNEAPWGIAHESGYLYIGNYYDEDLLKPLRPYNRVFAYAVRYGPVAPANLAAEVGDARVTLSWDDPSDSMITKYQYRVRADGGSSWVPDWTDIPSSGASTTSYTVTGLSNGTEYTFEVRAVESSEPGPESSVTATPGKLPAAPANLRGTSGPGFFQVTLRWNNPGDSSITKYQIRISSNDGSTWVPDWTDISGTGPNTVRQMFDFSNLGPTKERIFELRAVNSRGVGPASRITETPRDYPAPVAPRNFRATPGVSQVTLTWSDPGDILITNYQYRVRADGSSSWVPDWTDIPSSGASTTSYTVTGLTNDTEYTFEVRAQNDCTSICAYQGNGEASRDVATPEDVPDTAPPVIQTLAVNGVTLTLTYDEPLRDSVTPATTAFSVRVGSETVLVNRVNISGATVTLMLATAAENGQSVRLTYREPALSPIQDPSGNKAARLSNRSVTNNTPPPTVPNAPDALTASPQGQNQINLSWDAPDDNGGARITGYKIEVSEDEGSTWDDLEDNTRNADTTYSHMGLNLGTTRHYRVSAINRIGTSVPSAVEAATTDARPAVTLRASQISGEYFEYGGGRVPAYSIFIEFSQPVEDVDADVTESSICNGLTLTNARLRFCNAYALPSQNKPVIGTARPWLTTWQANIWPRAPETGGDITVTASLAANVARDASSRLNRASPPLSFTVRNLPASDTSKPRVSFTFRDSLPTVFTGPLDVFVGFFEDTPTSARQAEAVTGFTQSDVRVRGGRVTAFTPQTDAPAGHRYLVTIRPNEPSGRVLDSNAPWNLDDVTEMQISLSANAVQDAAGNRNEATESATFVARPRPTVTLSLPTETIDGYEYLANPSDAFNVTVTFSESVTGFTQNELRVSGARVGGPHGVVESGAATVTGWDARSNGREYVATITPTRVGTIEVSVSAGAATDSDGYRNLQSPSRKITLSGVP